MRAWYIREQKHILGTSDYAEVDLFETTDKEHTASTRRKRELATSIAQQKYNDMIARRYFCQLAYTNFGESDWAVTFTYDHNHQPAPGDFDQVDRDWTNFTRRLKRFCKKTGREASKWMQVAEYSVVDEDGKVTGRHHHHVILQGNLTWQEIKDLWRDSTGRPMGLVKVEPIDLTCSSFERLTTYMTKARARIRTSVPTTCWSWTSSMAAEPRAAKTENPAPERHQMEPQAL